MKLTTADKARLRRTMDAAGRPRVCRPLEGGELAEAMRLFRLGHGYQEIATRLGRAKSSVGYAILRADLAEEDRLVSAEDAETRRCHAVVRGAVR